MSDLPATIPALVSAAAASYGDAEAVADGDRRVSFAELEQLMLAAAAGCVRRGVQAGDRVGLWSPNTLDWVVAAVGALAAGASLVPVNTRFKADEAAWILDRSRAALTFVSRPFLGNDYPAMLAGRDGVVVLDDALWREPAGPTEAAEVRRRMAALSPGDTGDVIFTSGTTGRPKGVVTTHEQTIRVFDTWAEVVGLREGDRYLVVNPFFHTFGYKAGIIACLLRGATIVPQPVFDVPVVLDLIERERVTVLPGPPTLYQSILDALDRSDRDLSSLRLVVTGAAVVPVSLVERMRDELRVETVLTAYGLTEATGTVTMCRRGDDPVTIATTSGRAIPDTEVRVVDPTGSPVASGEPGEVVVRGYNVMAGYFEDPQATAETIDADGWLHTGDVGVMDAAGNLAITDRIKDMYVVGGFNAYPAEVEQLLATHPGIAESAVIGVPDERLGEVGRAFVVARPGAELDPAEVVAWCRDHMANYKAPRTVVVVSVLPRNASGKVLKFQLPVGERVAMSDITAEMARFRKVLGHFPTGVAVITGVDADGKPAGMAIGSFSSVSLNPPLVAFMPDKSSSSWPRFRDSGHFCVNILGSDQESVCRTFAVSGGDKFAELEWHPAGSGSPILDGVLAWIDCDIDVVHEAGDHFIVIGKVRELDVGSTSLPLVFFQGGYGRFSSLSLAAWESDLVLQMRSADLARPHMEELAEELEVESVASAVVGADMVLVARAGRLESSTLPTAVGQRIPFEPPMGTAFVAWAPPSAQTAWFARLGDDVPAGTREALDRTLADVRRAGYSIARGHRWHTEAAQVLSRDHPDLHRDETSQQMHRLIATLPPDYESPMIDADDVRTVSTPVFGPGGVVVLVLSVTVAGRRSFAADLSFTVQRLRAAAAEVTKALDGVVPEGES